jgi:uncharacterized membrane protein YkoI
VNKLYRAILAILTFTLLCGWSLPSANASNCSVDVSGARFLSPGSAEQGKTLASIGLYGPLQFSSGSVRPFSDVFEARRCASEKNQGARISVGHELEMSENSRQSNSGGTRRLEAKANSESAEHKQGAVATRTLDAPSTGKALPLKHILRQIVDEMSAKIIDVKATETKSGVLYRVKIRTTDGEIKSVTVDDKTGKIIEVVGF